MKIKQNQLVINDQLVNYYQLGAGKKAIIFLHGWRSNSEAWFGVLPEIQAGDSRVFCLDMPGFGGSPVPLKTFSLDDYAEIVVQFIKKMEIDSAIIVGHSFGGRVAIKIAAKNPELVDRLILVDSAGIKKEYKGRKALARFVRPLFKPSFMQGLRKQIYKKMGAEDYLATPELRETYLAVIAEDLYPQLSKIKSSTLLIWGENDLETPVPDAEIMKKEIKNSRLEVIKKAGHFSFIDQPKEFIQIINNFIN